MENTSVSAPMLSSKTIARKSRDKYAKYAYMFLAPLFIVYAIFFLYPLAYTLIISFSDMSGMSSDVNFNNGFSNYIYFFSQSRFYQSLFNTLIMWIYAFVFQFSFALIFAYIFTNNRIRMRGKGLYKLVYYLPKIITTASVAILFNMLWSFPSGTLYQVFDMLGIFRGLEPLQNAAAAQILYSSVAFWQWFGSLIIILAAGMLAISPSLYEAAEIDGASRIRTFFRITIPLLKPIILYVIITSMIGGLQSFELSYLFNPASQGTGYTPGGPEIEKGFATETLMVYVYQLAFGQNPYKNYAAALSMIVVAISALLSSVVYRSIKERGVK
jgi:multiple sugar transport system permease protein